MNEYYKHEAESEIGEGVAYMEIHRGLVVRQVETYEGRIFWSDIHGQSDPRFSISELPFSDLELDQRHRISKDEFEAIWTMAKAECR